MFHKFPGSKGGIMFNLPPQHSQSSAQGSSTRPPSPVSMCWHLHAASFLNFFHNVLDGSWLHASNTSDFRCFQAYSMVLSHTYNIVLSCILCRYNNKAATDKTASSSNKKMTVHGAEGNLDTTHNYYKVIY